MSIIENDLNPDVTIGLELPLTHHSNFGFFRTTKTLLEQTKYNLRNLLLTKKGERLGNPEFGCDVHTVLFENVGAGDFESRIEETIMEAVTTQLPHVQVNKIESSLSAQDKNTHIVNLSFSIDTDQTKEEELTIDITAEGY